MDIDSVAGCGMSEYNSDAMDERQLPIADLAVKIPPKGTPKTRSFCSAQGTKKVTDD